MSNNRRNRRTAKGTRNGILGKARARMKLSANVTEEQDWYLDTPDVRLTRIFTVVLLLHVVAIGGILAFKMVDKASETSGIKISTARQEFATAVQEAKALAVSVPAAAPAAAQAPAAAPVEIPARHAPAAPLLLDPSKNQYKVLAGDKLPEIAAQLGVTPEALKAKNAIISDNELYPGRVLDIPGKDEPIATAVPVAPQQSAAPAAAPVAETPAPAKPSTYQVKPGDTAWAIARKFNVPFNRLMSENGIKNAEALQIGQQLRIPAGN
jgi:LysM repeat protein